MAALVFSGAVAADIPPAPEVGSAIPDFKMKDVVTGDEHTLSAHKGKVVVLSFTSQECPYSRGAEAPFAETASEYKDKGVVFMSIDSHKSTTTEQIKEYATSKNDTGKALPYPILKDEGNEYADKLGATRTPEIYIIDKEGKLAYHGAIDNQKKSKDPDYQNYVAEALDSVLAGQPAPTPTRGAYGCTIKRKS
jgi:peroxiredoxin